MVGRGPVLDMFYFPSLEREPVGENKKPSFLRWLNHQAKSSTKGMRQRTRLSQTRGEDAGGRFDVAHVLAWLCACVHACTCKPNTKAMRQRARFSQTGGDDTRGFADVAHVLAWLCACAHACTCKPNTEAGVQRARFSQTRGGDARGCADVAHVLAWLCACAHACAPEGTPKLRMCWHGCARARMRALTNPTPKETSNARAFLRLGETTPEGYADVAHVLAWLCACAHACTCAQRTRVLFSAAAVAERK